jgi:hypothetical protein
VTRKVGLTLEVPVAESVRVSSFAAGDLVVGKAGMGTLPRWLM